MKTPGNDNDDPAMRDLETQMHARLRDTTREFEHRFDDLRRRLAQEPQRPGWRARFPSGTNGARLAWTFFAATATAAIVLGILLWHPQAQESHELTAAQEAAFGDMVALDDTLRDALPLTDSETLDALLSLPTSNPG